MKLNKILLVSIFLSHNCSLMAMEPAAQPKTTLRPLAREQVSSRPLAFDPIMKGPEAVSQEVIAKESVADSNSRIFEDQIPVDKSFAFDTSDQVNKQFEDARILDTLGKGVWKDADSLFNLEAEKLDSTATDNQLEIVDSTAKDISTLQKINPRTQRIIDFKSKVQEQSLKKDQQAQEVIQDPSIEIRQKDISEVEFNVFKKLLEGSEEYAKLQGILDKDYQTFYSKKFASRDSNNQAIKDLASANEMNERARNLNLASRKIIVDVWADVQLEESNSKLTQAKKAYSKGKKYVSNKIRTLISKDSLEKVQKTESEIFQTNVTEKILKSRLDSIFGVDKYSADSNVKLSDTAQKELDAEIKPYQDVLFNRENKIYSEQDRMQAIANISDAVINKVTKRIAEFTTIVAENGTCTSTIATEGLTSQTEIDPTGTPKSRTLSVLDEQNQEIIFRTARNETTGKVETTMFDRQGNSKILTAGDAKQVEQWQASQLACIVAKSTLKAVLYGIKMTPYVAYWALTTPHNIKSIVIMLAIEISKTSILIAVKAGSLPFYSYQDPVVSSLTNRIGVALSGSNRGWMSAERGRIFKRGSETSNWLRKMQGEEPESMNPDEEYYTCLSLVDDMVGHLRPQENAYLYGPVGFDLFGSNKLAPKASPAFSTEPVISPLHAQTSIQ
jgi:hypothetical protein